MSRPVATIAVGILLLLGGCASRRQAGAKPAATQPAAPSAAAPAGMRVDVRVVEAETGRPIDGATVSLASGSAMRLEPDYQRAAVTDARGDCTVHVDPAEANYFLLKASKPSRVPDGISLIGDEDEPLPHPVVLKLARGTSVGGVVKNEQGDPVAGAQIELDVPAKEGSGAAELITGVVATTGGDGRWSYEGVPADAEFVVAMASHPDYVGPFAGSPDTGWGSVDALRRGEAVTVLTRGVPVRGVVRDESGAPIPSATVTLGVNSAYGGAPPVVTDAAGAFRFEHVGPRETVLTAQAPGHAPESRQVIVKAGMAPVEFKLGPGRRLRGRVVGTGGRPVAGADVIAGDWRGRSSLRWSARTGPDGRFSGADLPADPITFTVNARGWMSKQVTLKPSPANEATAEQTIELVPPLRVAGSITDADTGAPIDGALVASGFNIGDGSGTRWDIGRRTAATDGKYRETMQGTMAGMQLRFEAEGYAPEVSRTFKPDEGRVTHDVKLRRRQGPAVVVFDPDGKPAAGVEVVALGAGQTDVAVQDGHVQTMYGGQVPSRSHADGGVDLELPAGEYVLLAVGEQGFVSVPRAQVAAHGQTKLTLKRWSRVTGHTVVAGKPATGQPVMVSSFRRLKSGDLTVGASVIANTIADEQGRFELKQCVPGPATVGRMVTSAERAVSVPETLATVDVKPAPEVTVVTLGGGRTVLAKVVPPDDFGAADWTVMPPTMVLLQGSPPTLPPPGNWLRMTEAEREKWTTEFKQTDAGRAWARQSENAMMFRMLVLARDGTVKADDVPPGSYLLTVQTSQPRWARGAQEFTVPEPAAGKDEGPLDIGNVELLPRFWPKPGAKPPADANQ